MVKRLYISGTNGTMMISNGDVNDAVVSSVNPIPYRGFLYFHSGLPYIQVAQKITAGNLTFPAQNVGNYDPPSGGGGGKGCCFIMLEARYGTGVLDEVVRRYRDENITEHNKRGYYKLAEVLVPLMREYKLIKGLVIICFASPLVQYAKWYYGYNKWGWIFTPVKKLWMKVFDILGQDTKFIRENGEII